MATTWREVVYNTITTLRKTFDDTDLEIPQVFFWARIISDRLAKDYIEIEGQKGKIGSNFLSVFNSVPVKIDKKGRKYIDIPTVIMELPNDAGIEYLTYGCETCTGDTPYNISNVIFNKTTPKGLNSLSLDSFTKPSPTNPYFYRVGCAVDGVDVNRIYLSGAECINFPDVELGVICGIDSGASCNLDDEIPLPPELIQQLVVNVLQLGRFLTLVPEERVNDATDEQRAATAGVPVAQSALFQSNVGGEQQAQAQQQSQTQQ